MPDLDIKGQTAASPGAPVAPRSSGKRARARDEQGQSIVEFAFVLPLFLTILFGFIWFAITLNNYVILTSATSVAAQYLSALQDITNTNPCQTIGNAFYAAGPGLVPADLNFTINIATASNGATPPTYTYTSVITNVPGGSSLPSCSAVTTTPGYPTQLVVSYPCSLTTFGFNFNCRLQAQSQYVSQ